MTQVELLARELYRVGTIAGNPHRSPAALETWESRPETVKIGFLAAARHVLARERAAVRRARGRTLAWAIGSPVYEFAGQKDTRPIGYDWSFVEEPVNVRMTHLIGKRVARVVAVPKRKKGAKR